MPYTVLVGPNNHGKSNIIRALLFFFDEAKITTDDFLKEEDGSQAQDLWVEVEYSNLTVGELENIPLDYLLDNARMRVRRECMLSDLKPIAHGYQVKDGDQLKAGTMFLFSVVTMRILELTPLMRPGEQLHIIWKGPYLRTMSVRTFADRS